MADEMWQNHPKPKDKHGHEKVNLGAKENDSLGEETAEQTNHANCVFYLFNKHIALPLGQNYSKCFSNIIAL